MSSDIRHLFKTNKQQFWATNLNVPSSCLQTLQYLVPNDLLVNLLILILAIFVVTHFLSIINIQAYSCPVFIQSSFDPVPILLVCFYCSICSTFHLSSSQSVPFFPREECFISDTRPGLVDWGMNWRKAGSWAGLTLEIKSCPCSLLGLRWKRVLRKK